MAGSISGFNICMMVFGALILTVGISTAPIHAMSAPDVPQNLQVSATSDSVTLTWDDPDDDSITGYKIFRKIANPLTIATVYVENTQSASTTFTDSNVVTGQTYAYRVAAISASDESEKSDRIRIHVPLPVPQNLDASVTHHSVTLTWDDPDHDDITGYKIFRKIRAPQASMDVYVENTGNTDTTFVDSNVVPSKTYVYRIAAVSLISESARSDMALAMIPPSSPQNPQALATHNSVTISWDDPDDDSITGYKISRKPAGSTDDFDVITRNTRSTDTAYIDTTVAASESYVYSVSAINLGGESPPSADLQTTTPPSQPQNLQASVTHSSVTLTWDAPDTGSADRYAILKSLGTANILGDIVIYAGNATTYTDTDIVSGKSYFYSVVAVTGEARSHQSSTVRAGIPPAPPSNLRAATTTDSVTISWDDPDDASITGYRILRGTPSNPDSLDTLVVDTGSTDTTYVDTSVLGETYLYAVAAINPGGESTPSNLVKTTVPYVITDSFDDGDSWTLHSYQYAPDYHNPPYIPFNYYTFTIDSQNGNPAPAAKISGNGFVYYNEIQQTIDMDPFNGDDLYLSIDYRVTSDYTHISTTNARLHILDSDSNTLYSESLIEQRRRDTGWQTSRHNITDAVAGHDSITIRLGMYDAWHANYPQVAYFDNFYLGPSSELD